MTGKQSCATTETQFSTPKTMKNSILARVFTIQRPSEALRSCLGSSEKFSTFAIFRAKRFFVSRLYRTRFCNFSKTRRSSASSPTKASAAALVIVERRTSYANKHFIFRCTFLILPGIFGDKFFNPLEPCFRFLDRQKFESLGAFISRFTCIHEPIPLQLPMFSFF